MLALVLSGGGLFGAYQAGAWRSLAGRIQPDLVVGASAGSLNGWLIAAGASPDELASFWLNPDFARISGLSRNIRRMVDHYPVRMPFALTVTDAVRLQPRTFQAPHVTWKHLAASCAVPFLIPPRVFDGRVWVDGGLLGALPSWAAVEMGATEIVAINVLPRWGGVLPAMTSALRRAARFRPDLPGQIRMTTIAPAEALGSPVDALRYRSANIERWVELGAADASRAMFSGPANENISQGECSRVE